MDKLEGIIADIELYCGLNDIVDTEEFIVKCLTDGFNIAKYGTSPFDNSKREKLPASPPPEEKKEEPKVTEKKKTRKRTLTEKL